MEPDEISPVKDSIPSPRRHSPRRWWLLTIPLLGITGFVCYFSMHRPTSGLRHHEPIPDAIMQKATPAINPSRFRLYFAVADLYLIYPATGKRKQIAHGNQITVLGWARE